MTFNDYVIGEHDFMFSICESFYSLNCMPKMQLHIWFAFSFTGDFKGIS